MNARVLLADDHALMREGLRSILERDAALEVVGEAGSGLEAVQLCKELSPDIVIMDVAMDDLNGVEATRRILGRQNGIRIVALSSHNDSRFIAEMLRAGAAAYVLKENAYSELRRALKAVQRGDTYLCPAAAGQAANLIRDSESGPGTPWQSLGPREREVLQLIAEGHSTPDIAERLCISANTVDTHRRNIMRKLELHNVVELTRYAIREGLTRVDD
ncbi:MAG TPA: response regulator transcription factor [Woeseiaceae bacterium]|nr:response regulator transcription factor [Woeseiaceae bacterium]